VVSIEETEMSSALPVLALAPSPTTHSYCSSTNNKKFIMIVARTWRLTLFPDFEEQRTVCNRLCAYIYPYMWEG
jgi:hypothetical protein